MEITIKINDDATKVSVNSTKGADYDIDLHRPSKYAVLTDYDEQTYLEGIFASLDEAKNCKKEAEKRNEQALGDNATTTIWWQMPTYKE